MSSLAQIVEGIKTFRLGGVHPPEHKEITEDKAIEVLPAPSTVYIPLSQHIGAPCEATVKKNDQVKIGDVVGRSEAFVSAPVHASVSGKVKGIELYPHPMGGRALTVVIENDGADDWADGIDPAAACGKIEPAKAKEYLQVVRDAGIVGMGGAAFPTHVKLTPQAEKPIDILLINGAECEPYLTSDYRVMLEEPDHILCGLRALMVIADVKRAVIAVENNKPRAVEALRRVIEDEDSSRKALGEIGVAVCQTKYPQGGERQLVSAVLDRVIPSGGLPLDVGVVVMNTGTCCAVADAVFRHQPVVERVLTVSGQAIPNPRNLRVRVGTPVRTVLDACGYEPVAGSKIIMGGPMMGKALRDEEPPVLKGTSGLTVLSPEEVALFQERPCLNCGRCVEVCPMGLMPSRLAALAENKKADGLKDLGLLDCVECGCCSFICPSERQLVQWIRLGKQQLREQKK